MSIIKSPKVRSTLASGSHDFGQLGHGDGLGENGVVGGFDDGDSSGLNRPLWVEGQLRDKCVVGVGAGQGLLGSYLVFTFIRTFFQLNSHIFEG